MPKYLNLKVSNGSGFFLFQRFAGSGTGGATVSFEGSETSQPNAQDKGEWEVS